jgi:hypothetical protein
MPAMSGAYSKKAKSCGSGSSSSSAESEPETEARERVIPFGGLDFCVGVGDREGPKAKQEIHLGEVRS